MLFAYSDHIIRRCLCRHAETPEGIANVVRIVDSICRLLDQFVSIIIKVNFIDRIPR